MVELLDMEQSEFSISCRFKNCEDDLVWASTRVYGSCFGKGRKGLYAELRAIKGL